MEKIQTVIFTDEYFANSLVGNVGIERSDMDILLKVLRGTGCRITEFMYHLLSSDLGNIESRTISIPQVYGVPIKVDMFNYHNSGMYFRMDIDEHYYLEDVVNNERLFSISRVTSLSNEEYMSLCRLVYYLYETLINLIKRVVYDYSPSSALAGGFLLSDRKLVFLLEELCDRGYLSDYF